MVEHRCYKVKRQAKGGELDKSDFASLKNFLLKNVTPGALCNCQYGNGRWVYFALDKNNLGSVVVTTTPFPGSLEKQFREELVKKWDIQISEHVIRILMCWYDSTLLSEVAAPEPPPSTISKF